MGFARSRVATAAGAARRKSREDRTVLESLSYSNGYKLQSALEQQISGLFLDAKKLRATPKKIRSLFRRVQRKT